MDKSGKGCGHQCINFFCHLIEIESGVTKKEIADKYWVNTSIVDWLNLPTNHETFKGFTVLELYDEVATHTAPTLDFSSYKDDEKIVFNGTRLIRVRLLVPQTRSQDARLSNLEPERKKNCMSHGHFRSTEQQLHSLEKTASATMTIDQINIAYASQKISHRAKAAAAPKGAKGKAKKASTAKQLARPKLGQGWKCDQLLAQSPTEPSKKVYEVLIDLLDNGRQSTLDVWQSYDKLMELLKWQYAPRQYLLDNIGPLTFEYFAHFCIRYPAEDVQYYQHIFFAHVIQTISNCAPGLDRSEAEECKHSWSKKKAALTTRGGGGRTLLSQLKETWFTEIYRYCARSEQSAMRQEIVDEASTLMPHSPAHTKLISELQEFDEIETIRWEDFLEIQRKHMTTQNRRRASAAVVDLTKFT